MPDFPHFQRAVHEAYAHLYDRAFLREHELTPLLGGAAERTHRLLLEAIEELRPIRPLAPGAVESRRYHHLRRRYLDGAAPEQIARELGVSDRQSRRDHADALDQVARHLWRRLGRATPPPAAPAEPPDDLDAALTELASADAGPTDPADALRGVVQTAARLAEQHRVAVDLALADDAPAVALSRTVVRQLLLGVLSEAIVANPGGRVAIALIAAGADADVTVEAAHPPRALPEPLRHLARSQRVDLGEESTPTGWRAHLCLPAPAARTLLLVDDNPDLALLFRRYLAGQPYRVVQARSAERALRLARELRPEAVFLDVLMPLADGWEVLQALRADPATADLRVVICSVLPDEALARSLGVTELLAKPVTRSALLAAVRVGASPAAARPAHP
jgi:CheY-like chemotaxis protein